MDDTEFEDFWFTLKRNMINYYHKENKIEKWSNYLNQLKEEKKYYQIQLEILSYLEQMTEDLIINFDYRLAEIFNTNLKRWNKIINYNNFLNTNQFKNYLYQFNIIKAKVNIIIKLFKLNFNDFTPFYSNYQFNIDVLLPIIVKQNQVSILEHLLNIYSLENYFLSNFQIDIKNLKANKIINLLKNIL